MGRVGEEASAAATNPAFRRWEGGFRAATGPESSAGGARAGKARRCAPSVDGCGARAVPPAAGCPFYRSAASDSTGDPGSRRRSVRSCRDRPSRPRYGGFGGRSGALDGGRMERSRSASAIARRTGWSFATRSQRQIQGSPGDGGSSARTSRSVSAIATAPVTLTARPRTAGGRRAAGAARGSSSNRSPRAAEVRNGGAPEAPEEGRAMHTGRAPRTPVTGSSIAARGLFGPFSLEGRGKAWLGYAPD